MKKILIFCIVMLFYVCGFAQQDNNYLPTPIQNRVTEQKSPSQAALSSAIFPGLGQAYNGQKEKTILFATWATASVVATAVGFVAGCVQGDISDQDIDFINVWLDFYADNEEVDEDYKKSRTTYNNNNSYSAHWGRNLFWSGVFSYAMCYVVSMIDAAISAKVINNQNGALSMRLSERTNLSFAPEVKPLYLPQQGSFTQSYGLNVSLTF